jgi:hypothetical protein
MGRHRMPEEPTPTGRHRSADRATRAAHRALFSIAGNHRRNHTTMTGRLAPPVLISGAIAAALVLNVSGSAPDAVGPHGAPGGATLLPWAGSGEYRGVAGKMVTVASLIDATDSAQSSASPSAPADGGTATDPAPGDLAPSGDSTDPAVPGTGQTPGAGDGATTDPDPLPSLSLPPVTLPSLPDTPPTEDDPTTEPSPSDSSSAPEDDPTTDAPTQGPTVAPTFPTVPPVTVPPVCVAIRIG